MLIMSYMCISFSYYATPWLLFTYITETTFFVMCCKNFRKAFFCIRRHTFLYVFAYLSFNLHDLTFLCNYTFITFEIPINVFSGSRKTPLQQPMLPNTTRDAINARRRLLYRKTKDRQNAHRRLTLISSRENINASINPTPMQTSTTPPPPTTLLLS